MASDRDNSGTLGTNRRKEKDSHPSHNGQATIGGVEYWISGWVKDGRDGSRFFSLAFKPKQASEHQGAPANPPARYSAPTQPKREAQASFDDGDEIPF